MRIDYVELPAPDLAAMKSFYGAAFGWRFTDYGEDYVDFAADGLSGGFNPHRPAGGETGALVIFFADDLAAAETTIARAGGRITERHEFPGGRRFHFRDPCGNELAVWTNA
ncbi:MAG: VOC family protein [Caulobacterales bacterium]|nr:VOC family protein [Caulobacterales bacterium]